LARSCCKEKPMKGLHVIALVLVVVGALNWGLVGAANFDLVGAIFGAGSVLARAVYLAVGISGILLAATSYLMLAGPRAALAPR
jgi:uncharacterized membrane protein YuzA (DUF378 family)